MSRWVPALRLSGVGFFIAACILLGTFGGLWLDGKLNTKPFFMIAGLILGLIMAGVGVYRMLIPIMNDMQNKENH